MPGITTVPFNDCSNGRRRAGSTHEAAMTIRTASSR
jgi:hypothetical protein